MVSLGLVSRLAGGIKNKMTKVVGKQVIYEHEKAYICSKVKGLFFIIGRQVMETSEGRYGCWIFRFYDQAPDSPRVFNTWGADQIELHGLYSDILEITYYRNGQVHSELHPNPDTLKETQKETKKYLNSIEKLLDHGEETKPFKLHQKNIPIFYPF